MCTRQSPDDTTAVSGDHTFIAAGTTFVATTAVSRIAPVLSAHDSCGGRRWYSITHRDPRRVAIIHTVIATSNILYVAHIHMSQTHADIAATFNQYIAENSRGDMSPILHIIRNYRGGMSPICVCVQLIIYVGCIGYTSNQAQECADKLVQTLCLAIKCPDVLPLCMRLYVMLMRPDIQHIDILYNVRTLVEHTTRAIAQFMNNVSYTAAQTISQQLARIWLIFNHHHVDVQITAEVQYILHTISQIMYAECTANYKVELTLANYVI